MPINQKAYDEIPNFFSTLWGAASDIPRAQPFADELSIVAEFNERVGAAVIVARTRPRVSALVAAAISTLLDLPVGRDELRDWREQVNQHVARAIRSASGRLCAPQLPRRHVVPSPD